MSAQRTSNPKQSAFQMDKEGLATNLRQSTDDIALSGYAGLAKELAEIKNLCAVFIPTSSGTTAQALHEEFKKIFQRRVSTDVTRHDFVKSNPQIHIVQTEFCHPIAEAYHLFPIKSTSSPSIAGAIVDNIAHRKEKVVEAIKTSKGNAWVCGNKEIETAIALIKKTEKIVSSPNSALAVAGLTHAIKNKRRFNGPVVCILTGR